MGSKSDWDTMLHADEVLSQFNVPHECTVVSAHRTPARMAEFAGGAEARGIEVIIAGAGGAAHLPGMVAAHTLVPVLGVPVESHALKGSRQSSGNGGRIHGIGGDFRNAGRWNPVHPSNPHRPV